MIQRVAYKAAVCLERPAVAALRLRPRHPPLFIVGVPRSGTTVVHLHLFNNFAFSYFPNVAKRHALAPLLYTLLGNFRSHYRPTYQSRYGIIEGEMAPSDGWAIFHRWFPSDDSLAPVDVRRLYELRNIVAALEWVFRAPFLNKNNSNSLRIRHLDRLFPNARFIWVRRKTVPTALSLIEARREHQTPVEDWWGAPPPQFRHQRFASQVDLVVHQVVGLTDFIKRQLLLVERNRWLELSYEQFCRDPQAVLDWTRLSYARVGVELEPRQMGGAEPTFDSRSRLGEASPDVIADIKRISRSVAERLRDG